MSLSNLLHHRRAVRYFSPEKILDTEKVKNCLKLSTLAPSSSNMQLYEFYHIIDSSLLQRFATACLNQQAAKTAQQMVVFVTRQDLYKERAKAVLDFEIGNIQRNSPIKRQENRIKGKIAYYEKLIPFAYKKCFGFFGIFRKGLAKLIGLYRPIYREISETDMRVVTHKSCALAVQTFMLAMTEQGYDTCPLEGFDSKIVKKLLNLPSGAEINMIICCGIRQDKRGIWGDRYRVPFEQIYHSK